MTETETAKQDIAAISVQELVKTFGHGDDLVTALDNVSLDIRQNEFFTLLGPSGCGKTTLLRLIAGFELPDRGAVTLHGEEIAHLPPHKRPVNTVFQSYALFPHLTVFQNIAFGLEMLGREKTTVTATVEKMLDLVRLTNLANRKPDQLSGGQQQRVALARALAPQPRVLLLDEPLAALDLKLRKEMQIELKRLQDKTGITFVFVTHDQEEALTMSDRIAVMNAGKVLQIGSPKEIYNAPTHRFVADFIGDINILTGDVLNTENNRIRVMLAGILEISLTDSSAAKGRVSVAVRPENAFLGKSKKKGTLPGTVSNVVFFGSGSNVYVTLGNGEEFTVRTQGSKTNFVIGDKVFIFFEPESAKILRD